MQISGLGVMLGAIVGLMIFQTVLIWTLLDKVGIITAHLIDIKEKRS